MTAPSDPALFRKAVKQALFWPLLILLATACALFGLVNYLVVRAGWVEHSDQVLSQISLAERLVTDRETGLRGYLSTRDNVFLEPYTRSEFDAPMRLRSLEKLVGDNATQTQRAESLSRLYREWNKQAEGTLHAGRERTEEALQRKELMDAFRREAQEMEDAEQVLRADREAIVIKIRWLLAAGFGVGAFLVAPFLFYSTRRAFMLLERSFQAALEDRDKSKGRMNAILESITDGMILVDAEGKLVSINEAASKIFTSHGLDVLKLEGEPFFNIFKEAQGLPLGVALQKTITHRVPSEAETYYEPWRMWISSRHFPTGERGVATFFRDVTEEKETERSLAETEDKFRRIVDSARDYAILSLDANGNFTTWNSGAERLFGYEEEEALGQHFRLIYTLEDREKKVPEQELERAGLSGHSDDGRWCLRKDGTRFYASGSTQSIRDERGSVAGYNKICQDRTGQYLDREALREAKARLEFVLRSAEIGEWDLDLTNDTSQRSLRHDQSFGYGEPVKEWGFETFLQHVHEADREKVRENFEKAVAELKNCQWECRVIWPNGETHWIAAHGSVYRAPEGKATRMLGTVWDITERKRDEEKLQSALGLLEAVNRATPDLIFAKDRQGRVTYMNEATRAVTGLPLEKILGKTEKEFAGDGEFARAVMENDRRIMESGRAESVEEWGPDGKRLFLITKAPQFDSEGKVAGLVGVGVDVTERKVAEKKLMESEGRFRAIAEDTPIFIWISDIDFNLTYVNGAFLKFLGLKTMEEFTGKAWEQAVHPEDMPEIQRVLTGAIQNHKPYQLECRFVDVESQEYQWFFIKGTPRYVGDQLEGFMGSGVNIHDRKLAERAHFQQLKFVQSITGNSSQALFMINPQGICEFLNPAAESMFGLTVEDSASRPLLEMICPSCDEREGGGLKGAVAGKQKVRDHEELFQRKDGEKFPGLAAASPIYEWGEHVSTVVEITNISKRKQFEQALRESEGRFRQLAESIDSVFWLTDWPGRKVNYVSPAYERLWGLDAEKLYADQSEWVRRIHPEDRQRVEEEFKAKAVSGNWNVEYRITTPDNRERWIHDRCFPVRNGQGEITRLAGVAEEITDRKRVEKELSRAQMQLTVHAETLEKTVEERTARLSESIEELEAFSYSISHDMRAPLRAMQGFSKALLEDYSASLPEEAQEYLQRIERGSQRLDMLIRDVLAYSRVAKGDYLFHRVDLKPLVSDILQSYGIPAERVSIQGTLPIVYGYEALLSQILSNLIENGIKFHAPGVEAQVVLRAEKEKGMAKIWVEDNGIGLSESHFNRIFMIFGRVHSEKAYEGTGIGLAIVKKAVERMGGKLGVESELGKGSKFWFTVRADSLC